MPFDGAGAFIGKQHAASANTNLVFETGNNGVAQSDIINTDGLTGMALSVTQTGGLVGTGAVSIEAQPREDPPQGIPFILSVTPIAAIGVPQLVEINHIATRGIRVTVAPGIPANPNSYRVLFMAAI